MKRASKCCKVQPSVACIIPPYGAPGPRPRAPEDRPITVCYADPPYPGMARKHYGSAEVDHADLVAHLVERYPDGWALSTSSTALQQVLALCPPGVRIGCWAKTYSIYKINVNPQHCWEPVIWWGGRRGDRRRPSVKDWVSGPITLRRGLVGAKPEYFCAWMFELLGLRPGDTLVDLFPGTGAVSRAWERWSGGRGADVRTSPRKGACR